MIRLVIFGLPATQGNHAAFVRGGRAVITEKAGPGRQRHADWRARVSAAAQEAHGGPLLDGPLVVRCTFGLTRPSSAPKTRRTWPTAARSGDVDKLARSVLDSLTGVIFQDDAQVVGLVVVKDYSDPPGVTIDIIEGSYPNLEPADWYPARLPGASIAIAADRGQLRANAGLR